MEGTVTVTVTAVGGLDGGADLVVTVASASVLSVSRRTPAGDDVFALGPGRTGTGAGKAMSLGRASLACTIGRGADADVGAGAGAGPAVDNGVVAAIDRAAVSGQTSAGLAATIIGASWAAYSAL